MSPAEAVSNTKREIDVQVPAQEVSRETETLIQKFHAYMNRNDRTKFALPDLMTRAFIQTSDQEDGSDPTPLTYVPFIGDAQKLDRATVLPSRSVSRNCAAIACRGGGHHLVLRRHGS